MEEEIRRQVDYPNPLLTEVETHIFNGHGKRLRPLLVLLCCKLCNYKGDKDIFLASIMEYVHAATLLHDDVLDEAKLRRGQVSAYGKWGNSVPILVGDYMYSRLIYRLAQHRMSDILKIVTDAVMQLTDGEIKEIIARNNIALSEPDYLEIITQKTAVLVAACCQAAANLSGASPEAEAALMQYGLNMGIAFQLVDDVLDFVGDEKNLGKPVCNDLKEGSSTGPMIRAIQLASADEVKRLGESLNCTCQNGRDIGYALELIRKYNGLEYSMQMARDYVKKAQTNLDLFEDSIFRQALYTLSEYVIQRRR